jgi:hypothetical protein
MAEEGRRLVNERFTIDAMRGHIVDLYENLLREEPS